MTKLIRSRWICSILTFSLAFISLLAIPQPAMAADNEYLNVSFGGTFTPQKGYTTGGEEIVSGGSITWQGDNEPSKIEGGGVKLNGNGSGITYRAKDSFGTTSVDKGFLAELEYLNNAAPKELDTLFSAMGNISVRVEKGKLVYGLSVKTANGTWKDYKQSVNLPKTNSKHIVQLKYEAEPAATLSIWVDGVKGPVARAANGEKAAVSTGKEKSFGIGYEINPGAQTTRSFIGNFYRARIAQPSAPWKFLNLSQLLHLDFLGSLNGTNYVAANGEDLQGTLSARTPAPQIKDSNATFSGNTSGLDFMPTDFSLGSDKVTRGLVAEVRFNPSETGGMQTLFSAGGNIFLRYNEAGQLEFGVSYQENGNWTDKKITASAPKGQTHVVSVAYIPQGNKSALYMRLDGQDLEKVTVNGLAALENSIANKVGFAGDVHPKATNRGYKGSFDEIRFAKADTSFTPKDFRLTYVAEHCDTSNIKPANSLDVAANECADSIKAKLSALRPTEKQADYLDWGQIGFVHFGINTFTGNSWGHGDEAPALINAKNIDTDQWAKTFADAGFKMMMVTVKHHDGFELFDSRYNSEHDWPSTTTAKNGGPKDLFAEIVKSARKHGLKVGVYYSPADSYMEKKGVWGNGSAKTERTIPTLVANDDRAERVASGKLPTYKYEATQYGEYMLNQLYELLTDYGTIDEVWFDGAQGNTSSTEFYDYNAFYDLIGKLQPNAIQANAAPDARWIGNEDGWARTTEWNPQAVGFDQHGRITLYPAQTAHDGVLGSTNSVIEGIRKGSATQLHWYPGEVDARNGREWFNNSDKKGPNTPKPVSELVKFYEQSTGRNSQFLLNMPPFTDGKMPQADVEIMRGYREELLRRYGRDLALGKAATVASSSSTAAKPAPLLTDGSKISSDENAGNTPIYTVNLGKDTKVDAVILGEDARSAGQQVEHFKVQGRSGEGAWRDLTSGTTIGQQRNLRFAETTVSEIRVVVDRSRGPVRLTRLEVYHVESEIQPDARAYFIDPSAPKAGDGLSADSPMTSIEQLHDVSLVPGSVILVKNGTKLTGDFAVFGYGNVDNPITVTTYGKGSAPSVAFKDVKASTLAGALTELGKDKAGWVFQPTVDKVPSLRSYVPQEEMRVVKQSSQNSGDGEVSNLLDGSFDTIWHSQWSPSTAKGPHWVVLDLGKKYDDLKYLDYLPRQKGTNGVAKEYKVWVSDSADDFSNPPLTGTLKNLPYTQRISLVNSSEQGEGESQRASGRFIKFQIDSDYSGQGFGSASELNVEREAVAPKVPDTVIDPTEPTDPTDPTEPEQPSNPEKPGDSDKPQNPGTSEKPGTSSKPGTGNQVANPGTAQNNKAKPRKQSRNNQLEKTGAGATIIFLTSLGLISVGGVLVLTKRRKG